MSDPPRELIGEFIDAVVKDPEKVEAMLAERPELLNARWIHDETVVPTKNPIRAPGLILRQSEKWGAVEWTAPPGCSFWRWAPGS